MMSSSVRCRCRFFFVLLVMPLLGSAGLGRAAAPSENHSATDAADPVARAGAFYEGIRTETLPNDLRVFLKPVPPSPVVTTIVAYKVGSADEDLDSTGSTNSAGPLP